MKMNSIKRIYKFGTFSNNSICMGIFITSLLIYLRYMYNSRFSISIDSTNVQRLAFNIFVFYIKYLEPVIILAWLKFICEFLFKVLNQDKK